MFAIRNLYQCVCNVSPLSRSSSLWVLFIGEVLGGPLHSSIYWELGFQDHTVELATLHSKFKVYMS